MPLRNMSRRDAHTGQNRSSTKDYVIEVEGPGGYKQRTVTTLSSKYRKPSPDVAIREHEMRQTITRNDANNVNIQTNRRGERITIQEGKSKVRETYSITLSETKRKEKPHILPSEGIKHYAERLCYHPEPKHDRHTSERETSRRYIQAPQRDHHRSERTPTYTVEEPNQVNKHRRDPRRREPV
ncbi:hypothetical protein FRC07_005122, partial [Ceratobasidium sp. 392]